MHKPLLFCTLFILNCVLALAQVPAISYTGGPKVFPINKQIAAFTPQNTGGAVPATTYGEVVTFAGSSYYGSTDGPLLEASFNAPGSIAVDKLGNLYVSDMGTNIIRKISTSGMVSTIAGNGTPGDADGQGTASVLNNPCGLAIDASGNIFFADRFNNKIKKISTTGMVTTFAGSGFVGSTNGNGVSAQFNSPFGVSIDKAGNLYITEQINNDVRKITPSGDVTTVNGAGPDAGFYYPTGSVLDVAGNLFIADNLNSLIKKVTPGGVLTVYAGSSAGFADGPALQAQFNQTTDITLDGLGNMFVADQRNNAIRKIAANGIVSTLANGNSVYTGLPKGVVYFAGKLYVTSYETNTIKAVNTTGYSIDRTLPTGLVFDSKTGKITGTPTELTPAANYLVTAYNTYGESQTLVNIQVKAPSKNIVLSGISLNPAAQLVSAGVPWVYNMPVINTTTSVTLTPTAQESNATIQVNGATVASGTASQTIALTGATTAVTILVTAEDGITKQAYTINIVKVTGSNNATLSGISIYPAANLVSAGVPWTYSFTVPGNTATVQLVATGQDSHATVTLNGLSIANGLRSPDLTLTGDATPAQIEVTAQDGVTKQVYNITIYRSNKSSNAVLSGIASNTSAPLVSTGVPWGYSFTVPANTTNFSLTPTAQESHAIIKINGTVVASGSSLPITLTGTTTAATIQVTAQDGTTVQTYNINIIKSAGGSNNAVLSGISSNPSANLVSTGVPWGYSFSVPGTVSSISITPTAQESHAVIKVNGTVVVSGTASPAITLTSTTTPVTIQVTAQDGTTIQTYNISIIKTGSKNANLSNIQLDPASQLVETGTYYSYNMTVPSSTATVMIKPTAQESHAKIKVNGVDVASGAFSGSIAVPTNTTLVTILVTAEDQVTTQTYKVNILKVKSSNTTIASATVSNGTRYNTGAPTDYRFDFLPDVTSTTLTVVSEDPDAVMMLGSEIIKSGVPSQPIPIVKGNTYRLFSITSPDGSKNETYTIAFIKLSTSLRSVEILPSGTLVASDVPNEYRFTVPVSTTSYSIKAIAEDGSVSLNGVGGASTLNSAAFSLPSDGSKTLVVTAADGVTKQSYTVKVVRGVSPTNANLSGITLNPSSVLTETGTYYKYTMTVPSYNSTVKITPTPQESAATILVNGVSVAGGTASGPISLTGDATPITIQVTAPDGVTKLTYTVTILKTYSEDTSLASIVSDPASTVFNLGNDTYRLELASNVTSYRFKPLTTDPNAKVTLENAPIPYGSFSQSYPIYGTDTKTFYVTSAGGIISKSYTVFMVKKTGSNNADLDLIHIEPAPVGQFDGSNYSFDVPQNVTTVNIQVQSVDYGATIKLNGQVVQSNFPTYTILSTGLTSSFPVSITSSDGTVTKNYAIVITKKTASYNANLSGISLNPAAPLVETGTPYKYTMTVPNTTNTVMVTATSQSGQAVIKINGTTTASGAPSAPITLTGNATPITIVSTSLDGTSTLTYTVTILRSTTNSSSITANKVLKVNDQDSDIPQLKTEIVVHQAVSPNGDGMNDVLQVEGIESRPDNRMMIMNRDGSVVYDVKGYNNSSVAFNGHAGNGKLQQPGTYFYTLEYKEGTEAKRKSGYIVIKY